MSLSVLNRIQREYGSFTDVERRIADLILGNPEKAVNLTLRVMSSEAEVSEGSVMNFANRLGFPGYTALKIAVAQSLSEHHRLEFNNIGEQDSPREAVAKMAENAASAFRSMLDINPAENFRHAAELLSAARRIEFYGVASSSMVALDAYYRFLRIGLPAAAVTDALISPVSASLLGPDCVAVAISYTGRTDIILRTMEVAKEQGASALCITGYSNSPLARLCDVSLIVASKETENHGEPTVSRLAQLLILDSLCAYIACQNPDVSIRRRARIDDLLDERYITDTERK